MGSREELRARRRAIERGEITVRSTLRGALVHPENLRAACDILRAGLRLTGLLRRGERNALAPVVTRVRFAVPALPRGLSGLRILHLSDLHADVPDALVDVVADRLRGIDADLCVLTGDYRFAVTGASAPAHDAVARMLRAVRAGHGIVGILGNHDYGETADALRRLGVRMLVNEALELKAGPQSCWLVGVDDPHYYRCDDLAGALAGVPAGAFTILLAHSPELVEAAEAGGVDVYLCGHTHGGQIALPLVGPLWLNARCPRAFTRGAWERGTLRGYTSAGIGCSLLPVRFNCPPEIVVIELQAVGDSDTAV